MKKLLLRLLTILIYLVALLWLADFKLWVLLDVKTIIMVAFGTGILTLSNYKKGMKPDELRPLASWNAMLTAYLTTFILLFSRLSGSQDNDRLLYDVAMNCRPLLYGLIFNILLQGDSTKDKQKAPVKNSLDLEYNSEGMNTPVQIKLKLREVGLTDREIEIVLFICDGHSNKEIAEKLFISESTVKKHTSNFYKKLNIGNREQLKQCIKELMG